MTSVWFAAPIDFKFHNVLSSIVAIVFKTSHEWFLHLEEVFPSSIHFKFLPPLKLCGEVETDKLKSFH